MAIWDEAKRRRNLQVHGLDFIDADEIWDDFTVTREDIRASTTANAAGSHLGCCMARSWYWSTPSAANTTDTSRSEKQTDMKPRHILKRPARYKPTAVVDPDNPPWTEKMLGPPIFRHGRGPQKKPTKVSTTLRLDREVLDYFRAKGPGYQTRINETLRNAMEKKPVTRSARRRPK
jgi:uncharacterized protein (DUF4415 family)